VSIWGNEPVTVPDTACACIEQARKEGIAQVRADLTDAIHGELTADDWRRLAAKVVVRLRGL
jgi:phage-related baseplate assembly protein